MASRRQLAVSLALFFALGPAVARTAPQEVHADLPNATLGGDVRFTFLGFSVYDASLWVMPGFSAQDYDRHAFALSLTYLRDFTGEAIAKRSAAEMRRQPGVTEPQLDAWNRRMREVFPDVRKGDRLTGIHRPGEGARFHLNGQPAGAIADADFSRRFFGIWLSAQSSDARLRDALAAQPATR
jgi:hypothetical protein